jgi:hypothetical protein
MPTISAARRRCGRGNYQNTNWPARDDDQDRTPDDYKRIGKPGRLLCRLSIVHAVGWGNECPPSDRSREEFSSSFGLAAENLALGK